MFSSQQPSHTCPSRRHVVTKATPNNLLLKLCRTKISPNIKNKNHRGHDDGDCNNDIRTRAEEDLLAKITRVLDVLGADPLTAKDSNNRDMSPLHYAAHRGNIPLIDLLITQYAVPVDIEAQNNWTPLYLAVRNGQLPAAKHLIETYGANVKVRNSNQANLVHAAASGGFTETIPYLVIEHGLDPFEADSLGFRPLLCASNNGHLHVIKFLVDLLGQSPHDTHGAGGATAAHYAVGYCHYDIVQYLMQTSFPEKSDRELWQRARQAYLEDKNGALKAGEDGGGDDNAKEEGNTERADENSSSASCSPQLSHRSSSSLSPAARSMRSSVGHASPPRGTGSYAAREGSPLMPKNITAVSFFAGASGTTRAITEHEHEQEENKNQANQVADCGCWCDAAVVGVGEKMDYVDYLIREQQRKKMKKRGENRPCSLCRCSACHLHKQDTSSTANHLHRSSPSREERTTHRPHDDGYAAAGGRGGGDWDFYPTQPLGGGGSRRPSIERPVNILTDFNADGIAPIAWGVNVNDHTIDSKKFRRANLSVCGAVFSPSSSTSNANFRVEGASSTPAPAAPFSSSFACSDNNDTVVAQTSSAATTPPTPGALFNTLTTAIHRATFGESFLMTAVEHGYADTAMMMIDSYLCEGLFTYWRNVGIPEATIVAVFEQNDRYRRERQQGQTKQSLSENNTSEHESNEEKNELFKLSPIGEALINSTPLCPHGLTTFHVACRASNMEIVERLLQLRPPLIVSSSQSRNGIEQDPERSVSSPYVNAKKVSLLPSSHPLPPFFVDINHVVNQEKLDAVRVALGSAQNSLTATTTGSASHYNGVDGWSPLHFVCATIADTNRYAREFLTAVPSTKNRLKKVAKRKDAVLSLVRPHHDHNHHRGHGCCESNNNNNKRRGKRMNSSNSTNDDDGWLKEDTDDTEEVSVDEEQEQFLTEREVFNFLAASDRKKGFQVQSDAEDDDDDTILISSNTNNNNMVRKGGAGTGTSAAARGKSYCIVVENSSEAHDNDEDEDEDDVVKQSNACLDNNDDDDNVPILPRITESMNTCQAFITLLLEHGADPNLPDVANATPLDVFLEYFLLGDARIRESEGFIGGGGPPHHGLVGVGHHVATETLARKLRAYHSNASACLETLLAAGATFDHHYQQTAANVNSKVNGEEEEVEEASPCDEEEKMKKQRSRASSKQQEQEVQRSLVRVVQRPSFINALTSFAPIPAPAPIQTYMYKKSLFSSPTGLDNGNDEGDEVDLLANAEAKPSHQTIENVHEIDVLKKGFEPSSSTSSSAAAGEAVAVEDRLLTSADAASPLLLHVSSAQSMLPRYAANHPNNTLNNSCSQRRRGGAQHNNNSMSSSSSWMLSSVDSIHAIKTRIAEAEAAKGGAKNGEKKKEGGRCCDRGGGGNDKCITSSSFSSPLSPSGREENGHLKQCDKYNGGGVDTPQHDNHDAPLSSPHHHDDANNNDNAHPSPTTSFSYSSFIFSPIPHPFPFSGVHNPQNTNNNKNNDSRGDGGGDGTKKSLLSGTNISISSLLPTAAVGVAASVDYHPLLAPAAHELLGAVRYDPTQPTPAPGGRNVGRSAMNPIPIPSLLTAPVIFTSTAATLDKEAPHLLDDNESEPVAAASISSPSSSSLLGSFITAANLRHPKLVVLECTSTSSSSSSSIIGENIGGSSNRKEGRREENKKPATITYVPTLVRQVSACLRSLSIYREGGAWSFGSMETSPVLQSLFAFYNEHEIPWEEMGELDAVSEERTESVSDAEVHDDDHDDDNE